MIRAIASGLAVLLLLAACTPPAPADPGLAKASAAAQDASTKLLAMAQGSETSGKMPTAADPTAAPLLNTLFDTSTLPRTPVPFAQVGPVSDWMQAVNQVGVRYMLSGTGVTDISAVSAAQDARVGRNLLDHAPEMGRYLDAALALQAVLAGSTADMIAADPSAATGASADGIAKIRGGVAQTATGLVQTVSSGVTADAWNEARIRALIAFAPNAARVMTPAQLAGLNAQITAASAASHDPALQAEYSQLQAVLAASSPKP